ncbi:peptide MFS transporter [bacterium]|nr:peptide MFS transporter [bacterium]
MQNTYKQEHHKGLYLLFFTEMWERFSYYGMRALIVLYMIEKLSYSTTQAGNIYGFYTGFVYLTPLLGGYIADKFLGQRKCIEIGAYLMILGLFSLTLGGNSLFLISLFLMISANGFFKSNISSVLGLLYENNPNLKDSAYTIFYMGINLGAFFSPLICGTLAVKYGYNYGFLAAGVGMLIGISIYKILEHKLLGECGLKPFTPKTEIKDIKTNEKSQTTRLWALFGLMLFTIPFWICFEQAGSSLTLFAQYSTNRNFLGYEIPTGYFQSLNPLFIITLAPLTSVLWKKLRSHGKEPSSVEKFAIALFLISVSFIVMTYAGYLSETTMVSPFWLIGAYFIMTIAELCLSPIGLSLVSKLAPKKFLSLIMGGWFLTSFVGNLLAGIWGGKFEEFSTTHLFGILALLSFISCILLVFLIPFFSRSMRSSE